MPVPATSSRPLHVLMVTGAYPTTEQPYSGAFIKDQADSLIAEGVQVDVIHPRPGFTPLRYASALCQVFFRTWTGTYDVVHGHYGLWCLVARMQWRTPAVASFLGSDLLSATNTLQQEGRKHARVARLSQWLARSMDAVIVKSDEMRQLVPSVNAFVIPNGVNFELFRPIPRAEARAALGWNPEGLYVLFGNDPQRPVKDYPLAQAAVERVRARGVPLELMVASGLPHDKIPWHMNASNVLLLTSVFEGSPNVVKEAMACNLPVVATNVGDVAQVIGRTEGCSVCPRDADALADALQRALRHDTPTTGRADIAHLDRSRVARQIIDVYHYARKRIVNRTEQVETLQALSLTPPSGE